VSGFRVPWSSVPWERNAFDKSFLCISKHAEVLKHTFYFILRQVGMRSGFLGTELLEGFWVPWNGILGGVLGSWERNPRKGSQDQRTLVQNAGNRYLIRVLRSWEPGTGFRSREPSQGSVPRNPERLPTYRKMKEKICLIPSACLTMHRNDISKKFRVPGNPEPL